MKQLKKHNIYFVCLIIMVVFTMLYPVHQVKAAKKVKKLEFEEYESTLTIRRGEQIDLKLKVTPTSAKKAPIRWSSSKSSAVRISTKGEIYGMKKGTSTITAKAADGSGKKVKLKVTVGNRAKKVKISNAKEGMKLVIGETYKMKAKVTPSKTSNKKVKWMSEDEDIATVDGKGNVRGVSAGTVTICAMATDGSGVEDFVEVEVVSDVKSVSIVAAQTSKRWGFLDNNNIITQKGTDICLAAQLERTEDSKKKPVALKWASDNEEVATVSNEGNVKIIGYGDAVITVNAQNKIGKVKICCKALPVSSCGFIAHRGRSDIAPENTLAAMNLALQCGYEGVELDVVKTSDNELVVSHDASLLRMCGIPVDIGSLTLEQVISYRIINGTNVAEYPTEFVPSLDQVLRLVARYSDKTVRIELKEELPEEALVKLIKKIRSFGLEKRVIVISFYENNIKSIRKLKAYGGDFITLEYLTKDPGQALENVCIPYKAGLDTEYTSLQKEDVIMAHRNGLKVNVWTVDNFVDAYRMVYDMNVDYMTTAYPMFE